MTRFSNFRNLVVDDARMLFIVRLLPEVLRNAKMNLTLACSFIFDWFSAFVFYSFFWSFVRWSYLVDLTVVGSTLFVVLRDWFSHYVILISVNFTFLFSLSNLFPSCNWLEREIFDMFGILFINHSNLRRILCDYGFRGFPLRKDFPVFGFKELRFDCEKKQVVYCKVRFSQSWRQYTYNRQWF